MRIGLGSIVNSDWTQALVVAIARAQHHAVLAELHRLRIAISRQVADAQGRLFALHVACRLHFPSRRMVSLSRGAFTRVGCKGDAASTPRGAVLARIFFSTTQGDAATSLERAVEGTAPAWPFSSL